MSSTTKRKLRLIIVKESSEYQDKHFFYNKFRIFSFWRRPKFKVIPPDPIPPSKSEEVVTGPSVEDLDYSDEDEIDEDDDNDKPLSLEENLEKIKLVAAPKKKLNFSPHKKKVEEEVNDEDDGEDDDDEDEGI